MHKKSVRYLFKNIKITYLKLKYNENVADFVSIRSSCKHMYPDNRVAAPIKQQRLLEYHLVAYYAAVVLLL